jgi:hypothetical protein
MAFPENAENYTHKERTQQFDRTWEVLKARLPDSNKKMNDLTDTIYREAAAYRDFVQYDALVIPYRGDSKSKALDGESFDPVKLLRSKEVLKDTTIEISVLYSLDKAGSITSAKIVKCSDEHIDKSKLLEQFRGTYHQPRIAKGQRVAEENSVLNVTVELVNRDNRVTVTTNYKMGTPRLTLQALGILPSPLFHHRRPYSGP